MQRLWFWFFCCFLVAPGFSQKAADETPTTVIRSNPRLVLINLLATDSSGKPVHGLSQHDFTVLEDGKPQSIRGFEEHSGNSAEAQKTPPQPNFGPNIYTNYFRLPKDEVTNILLFDVLNMSSADLVQAKAELIKTVQNLPAGQRFALFILGSELRMLQGFTWNKEAMLASADGVGTKTHGVYADARTFSTQIGELKETMLLKNPVAFEHMVTTLATEQDVKYELREQFTFDGLYQLARALVAIPGRKNLIWITSGFPFDPTHSDERFRRLSSQLAANQVAVYPIDARGVMTGQADALTRDSETFGAGASSGFLQTLSDEMRSTYETMLDIAAQTGGRAFLNQNTFLPAISRIVESGANYYVLAYRPTNDRWDGSYRKIQVKSSHRDVKLVHRTGYYAIADPQQLPSQPERDHALQIAMQPAAPTSTSLIIKTRVVSPQNAAKPVTLDYLIDVSDLAVTDDAAAKKKALNLIYIASASNDEGKVIESRAWTVKTSYTEEELSALKRRGLQVHEEFPLAAGEYHLRLGILDRNSGKIGTVDVPVAIAQSTAK